MKVIDRSAAWCIAPMRALVFGGLSMLAACGGGYGGGGGMNEPTVTLTAAPETITLGQTTTLSWSASVGTVCTAGGAWSGSKAASGSESVTPGTIGNPTYSLTCTGGKYRGTGTETTTVTVNTPSAFSATRLVTDAVGAGAVSTDANLVNPWGIAFGTTSPMWVANNHGSTSTVYDGNGKPQPLAAPVLLHLPQSAGGADFGPTGIVFNGSTDFVVTAGDRAAAARFIFAGEGGMIAGWSPAVAFGIPVVMYTDAGGAVYTGLAICNNGTGNFLYAADFRNGNVDVFDASFNKQPSTATSFAFADSELPDGYAPFGIQAIATGPGGASQIYVAYAKRASSDVVDEVVGPGLGLVDVFDPNGNLVKRLVVAGGALNAPWGLALAPANAGSLSNALLVGNSGDGKINGYDPATGTFLGTVVNSAGEPFAVRGLWGIAFGNGTINQPRNTLFYAAGTNDEANGEFGRIDLGTTAPTLNTPPVVAMTAPAGTVHGVVDLTATATASANIAEVEFFLNGTVSLGTATASPYTISWDTRTVADGASDLTARATDVDGNVGVSQPVTVTVSNAAPVTTLAELQTLVFTPLCAGCHNGSNAPGGALPGSQDLRSGHSFASLVGVASLEQPSLRRVQPGDAANSYLIRKLEGAAGISGSRMPLGGPFLDATTIEKVKSWINRGALND